MKAKVQTIDLKRVLNSIKKSVSKDYRRDLYTNIKIECDTKALRIISCDGYRLAYNQCLTIHSDKFECLIPFFLIPKNASEYTELVLENNILTIDFGIYKISYKVIEGDYLDYKKIIRNETNFKIGFDPLLMKEILSTFKEPVELAFNINNNCAPVIISNSTDENHKAIVLPYRLKDSE